MALVTMFFAGSLGAQQGGGSIGGGCWRSGPRAIQLSSARQRSRALYRNRQDQICAGAPSVSIKHPLEVGYVNGKDQEIAGFLLCGRQR